MIVLMWASSNGSPGQYSNLLREVFDLSQRLCKLLLLSRLQPCSSVRCKLGCMQLNLLLADQHTQILLHVHLSLTVRGFMPAAQSKHVVSVEYSSAIADSSQIAFMANWT